MPVAVPTPSHPRLVVVVKNVSNIAKYPGGQNSRPAENQWPIPSYHHFLPTVLREPPTMSPWFHHITAPHPSMHPSHYNQGDISNSDRSCQPRLKALQWLPVSSRIKSKILSIALQGLALTSPDSSCSSLHLLPLLGCTPATLAAIQFLKWAILFPGMGLCLNPLPGMSFSHILWHSENK